MVWYGIGTIPSFFLVNVRILTIPERGEIDRATALDLLNACIFN